MSIKNVVLVGAGGNLGPAILHTLLNNSSFNVTILSRQGSSSTFPENVKVVHADYESIDSLKSALEGQDAIVSNVAGHALSSQIKIIDAAIAAGVKRFIPSEFGSNTTDPRILKVAPFFQSKIDVQDYLKSKSDQISYTTIVNGPFLDWCLKVGFVGLDSTTKTAKIFDGGDNVFSGTNLRQVGLTVVKVLEKAEETKNQQVVVSSFETSQNALLKKAEEITGEKWKVENVSSEDWRAAGFKKLEANDHSGVLNLIQAVILSDQGLSDHRSLGLWNDKLGLEKEDFDESVKAGLGGKLYRL